MYNKSFNRTAIALLGYSLKGSIDLLKNLVSLICIVGIIASYLGYKLLIRIGVDTELRQNQLLRVESELKDLPLYPYTEGKKFFFDSEVIAPGSEFEFTITKELSDKGIRGIDAYRYLSFVIGFLYLILSILGVCL